MPMTAEERSAWLAERRNGIGGSDAAVAIGLSKYKSPFKLWLEKRGEIPEDDLSGNSRVEWGIRLEDTVAEWYCDKTGERVARVNSMIWNKAQLYEGAPFMFANLDRRVVGKKKGLEIKTASFWVAQGEEWGPSGEETGSNDLVPMPYLLQCQHYMAVTGYPEWDLAALIGGNDPRLYTIKRNEELIASLVKLERSFWHCVKTDTPPAALNKVHAKEKFPAPEYGKVILATKEIAELCAQYKERSKALKAEEKEVDLLAGKILDYIGDGETLMYDDQIIATWKQRERKEYTVKPSATRVFLVK